MQVPQELASDLLAPARYGAGNLLLAQASGGNNSVKSPTRDVIWIKASGKRLAEVSLKEGIVALRCDAVEALVREQGSHLRPGDTEQRRAKHEEMVRLTQSAVLDPSEGRPSLETGFHCLLGNVVLHLHPVYLNAFGCMQGGREMLSKIAPQQFVWLEYATPGWELAAQLGQAIDRKKAASKTECFVLENHGFITSANTARQAIEATAVFLSAARSFFEDLSPALFTPEPSTREQQEAAQKLQFLYRERWRDEHVVVRPARFLALNQLDDGPLLENAGPLVPDDVVYGCEKIHCCAATGLRDFIDKLPAPPDRLAVAMEGRGTLLLARNEALLLAMEELLLAHVLVRILVARRGCIRTLPRSEVEYLQSMESEKYRVMVCSKGAS